MRTKVKGFEVYTMYVAMKAHFKTKSYDFVEFGGRIRSRVSSYEKRKDKYYFEKLARKYNEQEVKEGENGLQERILLRETFVKSLHPSVNTWKITTFRSTVSLPLQMVIIQRF